MSNDDIIRVKMFPDEGGVRGTRSGIATVVRAYHRVAPKYGIEFVGSDPDVTMIHGGIGGSKGDKEQCDIAMLHGIYFTGEYNAIRWEKYANKRVIENALTALSVTVPSDWVASTIRNEFKIDPYIVDHGVFFDEWQHTRKYNPKQIFWGKNRIYEDVCDPTSMMALASRMPDYKFIVTLAPNDAPSNVIPLGVMKQEDITRIVQESAIVLSTVRETWGILYIESMAAGTPVVSVNIGHVPYLSPHGVAGYNYRNNDLDDMERGILWAIEHRETLSSNAKKIAKEYTWDKSVETLRSIVEYTRDMKDAIRI